MQIFINNIENRAAYFKGSIFANDQNRDEELTFNFAINSKFDGFNVSRNVMFSNYTKGEGPAQLRLHKVRTKFTQNRNFWKKDTFECDIDITLDTM